MKRFSNSRRCLTWSSAILPAIVAFSCMILNAQAQSQPKLESPEDLRSAPGLTAPREDEPRESTPEIIVVEPDQVLLPEVEQAMPELDDYHLVNPPPEMQYQPRPQLGVAGKLIRGWGFQIVEIIPGSAADRMQLERGDVILKINGQCVSSIRSIEQQLVRSVGEFAGRGIIQIDNVRGRTRCGTAHNRFLWLKFQL